MTTPWVEWTIRASFAIAGFVHLMPLTGVLGRSLLERAYGVSLGQGQDLVILMQHRALLFGLLACACLVAVKEPVWRLPVGMAVLVSMVGFIVIAATQPHGPAIARVASIDYGVTALVMVAIALQLKSGQGH